MTTLWVSNRYRRNRDCLRMTKCGQVSSAHVNRPSILPWSGLVPVAQVQWPQVGFSIHVRAGERPMWMRKPDGGLIFLPVCAQKKRETATPLGIDTRSAAPPGKEGRSIRSEFPRSQAFATPYTQSIAQLPTKAKTAGRFSLFLPMGPAGWDRRDDCRLWGRNRSTMIARR
jgi:hypothetical protein